MNTNYENYGCENNTNQYRGLAVGLLVGGLTGAGAMLFLAPQSGKKLRADIKCRSMALRDKTTKAVEDTVAQVRGKAHHITETVHDQAQTLGKRGHDAIDEQRDNLGQTLKDLGKTVHT